MGLGDFGFLSKEIIERWDRLFILKLVAVKILVGYLCDGKPIKVDEQIFCIP